MTGKSSGSVHSSYVSLSAEGVDPYFRELPNHPEFQGYGPVRLWVLRRKEYKYCIQALGKVRRKCSSLMIPSIPPSGALLFAIGLYLLIFYGFAADKHSKLMTDSSVELREMVHDYDDVPGSEHTHGYSENESTMMTNESRAVQRLPSALIIGARKAGTRALIRFLSLHPHVRAADQEIHFFDREVNYRRGLDWYRQQMPVSYEDEVTIEKTPSYFIYPHIPGRIHKMNSSIKLILVVRDPVQRAISDYTQTYSRKKKRGDFYPAFEKLAVNMSSHDMRINLSYRPLYRSLYSAFMERWLKRFPRKQFHVVDGDRLVQSPVEELRKVETFLRLNHRIAESDFYFNKTRGFYCVMRGGRQTCLSPSKGRVHPYVPPIVVQKLNQFYEIYNTKFYKLVGHNFGWGQE